MSDFIGRHGIERKESETEGKNYLRILRSGERALDGTVCQDL